jgi:hypothetical protein
VTYYEVLGVGRDASYEQIRAAFRKQARAHHPDTNAAGSTEALAPVNEAWRVLGDPALRADYDRSLRTTPTANVWAPADIYVAAPPESTFPWRFLAGLAAVGIGFAVFGVFSYRQSEPAPPDRVLEHGSCVVIESNSDVAEVNCEAEHDGVVDRLVGFGETCPAPFEAHRDRQGLGVACVEIGI